VSSFTVEVINTNNPEQEIWNYLYGFESEHFVKTFVNYRIKQNFYNIDLKNTMNQKIQHNAKYGNQYEILKPLENISDNIVLEITNNAKQARAFFFASKQLSLLSKPILLFYAFEKLANLLMLSTFQVNEESQFSHGITYKNDLISIKNKGLFQRFHDSYSDDAEIYLKNRTFTLDSLLNSGKIYDSHIFDEMEKYRFSTNNSLMDSNNESFKISEFDREFLFLFTLSTLARYKVNNWSEMIEAKESDVIVKIDRYLQSVQILFPNFVLNTMYGKTFFFYPFARLG
jgi:hypothetical protein